MQEEIDFDVVTGEKPLLIHEPINLAPEYRIEPPRLPGLPPASVEPTAQNTPADVVKIMADHMGKIQALDREHRELAEKLANISAEARRVGYFSEEGQAVLRRGDPLRAKQKALEEKRWDLEDAQRDVFVNAMPTPEEPLTITPEKIDLSEPQTQGVDAALAFIGRVANAAGKHKMEFRPAEGGRAFYRHDEDDRHIALSSDRPDRNHAEIVTHELGHWLNRNKPGVLEKTREFLAKRTAGEQPVKLNTLRGGGRYGDDEVGVLDHFDRHFGDPATAAFVGKTYIDEETGEVYDNEVLSMGLQELYTNPAAFAHNDSEFFKLIVEILMMK